MNEQSFLHRACPGCGERRPREETRSEPRAEALTLDALRPYWAGLFKDKIFFSYDRCAACGLLYAPTYFTPDQIGELYADMAPNMSLVTDDAIAATQGGYWETAKGEAPPAGDYIEIGPDIGHIVGHAARDGRFDRFWLFEPNLAVHAALAGATAGRPHDISTGMEDLSSIPDGTAGMAVLVHVLDHLLDPMAMLTQLRAKLKPGGLLMMVTHNEASVLRRVMATKWPPFCLQHPEIYNPASMTALVRRAGFGSVEVRRSKNYFPIGFMVRQAAYTVGLKLDRVPLPRTAIGLKLGNIVTLARA